MKSLQTGCRKKSTRHETRGPHEDSLGQNAQAGREIMT